MASELEVNKAKLGTRTTQGDALLGARANGDSINFGHGNQNGYGSNIGCGNNNGHPYVAFSCEHGTNDNTFKTRGLLGNVIQATNNGELKFKQVTNADADNQTATERLTIDSTGNVSIGTAGTHTLHVQKDVDDYIAKFENDGNATTSNGVWIDTRWNTATNSLFKVTTNSGAQEVLNIDGTGLATFSNGIAFNQTNSTAASNITTTLDHYERGVWTPVIADAATGGNTGSGSTVTGYYERIGNAVTVTGLATNVNTSGMTGENVLHVRGLPFPSGYSSGTFGDLGRAVGSCVLDSVNTSDIARNISTMVTAQNSYFLFHQTRDSGGDSNLLVNSLTSGTADLFFTFTYFVD